MMIRRGVSGAAVHVPLAWMSGEDYAGPAPAVFVCPAGLAQMPGAGAMRHVGNGLWEYLPPVAEYDAELVTFSFLADGMKTWHVHVYPAPAAPLPPVWGRGDVISQADLLQLLAVETPAFGTEWWVSALLERDTIPMNPAILTGLNRAFPRIFPL